MKSRRPQVKVSITDVARRAKVSITTVSRVLNGIPSVSPKNRAKVEKAIADLKYKPNIHAQRLARGIDNAVALVMPGYPGVFHSFYAVELIRGVGHVCEMLRIDLLFHITNGFNDLDTSTVGGVIFADIIENRRQVLAALERGVPCLVINHVVDDMDVSYIGVDNFSGGRMAADYLLGLGHRRVAVITGNLQTQAGRHRFEGFQDRLTSAGGDVPRRYVYEGDYSRRSAREGALRLLSLSEPPTAIFASSDDMALEVIAVALERGLRVPEDLSVVGFDDNPSAIYGPVALTTVKQPLFQMAEYSVKYLNNIILGKRKTPVQKVLSPQLVVRDSCAVPAA